MSKNSVVGEEGLEPPVSKESGFQRKASDYVITMSIIAFRYPVYSLYTFINDSIELSTALFVTFPAYDLHRFSGVFIKLFPE